MDTRQIAKEIISIKVKKNKTLGKLSNEFYSIMRKHGIKQCTQRYNDNGEKAGLLGNNFEWTTFLVLFQDHVSHCLAMGMGFGDMDAPEDLEV